MPFLQTSVMLLGVVACVHAQTKLKLKVIQRGTELVTLISNGDIQSQGSLIGANHPKPTGWNRGGEISVQVTMPIAPWCFEFCTDFSLRAT